MKWPKVMATKFDGMSLGWFGFWSQFKDTLKFFDDFKNKQNVCEVMSFDM